MPRRDFDAARSERQRDRDPIAFTLGGEDFTCVPSLPIGLFLDLAEVGGHPLLAKELERCLIDADRERFAKLLRRESDPIGVEDIEDIHAWLVQEYAARPTGRSTGSPAGPLTNGDRSSSEHSEMASTSTGPPQGSG